MFELNIAAKYLLPRWRRLSLSLISMVAIFVITLVVWLILVFFSVTNGLEKMWIDKLVVLTGPARVYPTDQYYKSHYYLIDSISNQSDFQSKSLEEKFLSTQTDPWDHFTDQEIPPNWPEPLFNDHHEQKDLVKELITAINEEPNLKGFIYEVAPASLKLKLERRVLQEDGKKLYQNIEGQIQQNAFILSFDTNNTPFRKNLIPIQPQDIDNIFKVAQTNSNLFNELLSTIPPQDLKTPSYGWILPKNFYDDVQSLTGVPIYSSNRLKTILIPNDPSTYEETIVISKESNVPLIIDKDIPVSYDGTHISFTIQDKQIKGSSSIADLDIVSINSSSSLPWIHESDDQSLTLPSHKILGDGILLPKSFQDAGALIGDRGYLIYETPSFAATTQAQLPIYIAGFYDPGIMAMGGKFILVPKEVASLIHSSIAAEPYPESNGIQLRFDDYTQIDKIKKNLINRFKKHGIAPYFTIETYEDYDFAKGFIQELKSQKNLFLILSGMIIIVACSNIISMLIILVNDKKKEIGILRALGAKTISIGSIFGFIGLSMGLIGSLFGIVLSMITLYNLPLLIGLLSRLQGFDAFQRLFYNNAFPTSISLEALQFVIISTTLTSLLAALIPAIKACSVKPAAMLRSE